MAPLRNRNWPAGLVLGLLVVAVAWLTYGSVERRRQLPETLRFVPASHSSFVVTSPIEDLWHSGDVYVGRYFQTPGLRANGRLNGDVQLSAEAEMPESGGAETAPGSESAHEIEAGIFTELAGEIRDYLDEHNLPVGGLEDLRQYGLDVTRGVTLAHCGPFDLRYWNLKELETEEPRLLPSDWLVVVPIWDADRFVNALERVFEGTATGMAQPVVEGGPPEIGTIAGSGDAGTVHFAFSSQQWALVSNSDAVIRDGLAETRRNWEAFRNDDDLALNLGLAAWYRKEEAAGIIGRLSFNGVPWVQRVFVQLELAEGFATLAGNVHVDASGFALVRRLMTPATTPSFPPGSLDGGVAVYLNDEDVGRYAQTLSVVRQAFDGADHGTFWDTLAGILASGRPINRLAIVSLPGRGSAPDWLIAAAMSETDATRLVHDFQKHLRMDRDRTLLNIARDTFMNMYEGMLPGSPADLVAAGLLGVDRTPLWERFAMDTGTGYWRFQGYHDSDFAGPDYVLEHPNVTLKYVLPPYTHDDAAYLLPEAEHQDLDLGGLLNDEYRMCSAYVDGWMLFATDAKTLLRIFHGEDSPALLADARGALHRRADSNAKLAVFVNPTWVVDQGLLYGDSEVQQELARNAADFDHFRTVELEVVPDERWNAIRITCKFTRS